MDSQSLVCGHHGGVSNPCDGPVGHPGAHESFDDNGWRHAWPRDRRGASWPANHGHHVWDCGCVDYVSPGGSYEAAILCDYHRELDERYERSREMAAEGCRECRVGGINCRWHGIERTE